MKKLFKTFAQFLEDNKLEYFVIGGTMIGMMREKGMIAWDDDVDISMTQYEVSKLLNLKDKLKDINMGVV